MSGALTIIRRHIAEADRDRLFHKARGGLGNLEAMIAALKAGWLRGIERELMGASGAER